MREQQGSGQAVPSPCWCLRWFRFLQSVPLDTGTLVWLTELDEKAVLQRVKAAYVRAAAGSSTTDSSRSSSSGAQQVMGAGTQAEGPAVHTNARPQPGGIAAQASGEDSCRSLGTGGLGGCPGLGPPVVAARRDLKVTRLQVRRIFGASEAHLRCKAALSKACINKLCNIILILGQERF